MPKLTPLSPADYGNTVFAEHGMRCILRGHKFEIVTDDPTNDAPLDAGALQRFAKAVQNHSCHGARYGSIVQLKEHPELGTAKIVALYGDTQGGVRLDRRLRGFVSWNVQDLDVVLDENVVEPAGEDDVESPTYRMSPEAARRKIEALKADHAWSSRFLADGAAEKAEWSRLQRLANP